MFYLRSLFRDELGQTATNSRVLLVLLHAPLLPVTVLLLLVFAYYAFLLVELLLGTVDLLLQLRQSRLQVGKRSRPLLPPLLLHPQPLPKMQVK